MKNTIEKNINNSQKILEIINSKFNKKEKKQNDRIKYIEDEAQNRIERKK